MLDIDIQNLFSDSVNNRSIERISLPIIGFRITKFCALNGPFGMHLPGVELPKKFSFQTTDLWGAVYSWDQSPKEEFKTFPR